VEIELKIYVSQNGEPNLEQRFKTTVMLLTIGETMGILAWVSSRPSLLAPQDRHRHLGKCGRRLPAAGKSEQKPRGTLSHPRRSERRPSYVYHRAAGSGRPTSNLADRAGD